MGAAGFLLLLALAAPLVPGEVGLFGMVQSLVCHQHLFFSKEDVSDVSQFSVEKGVWA